MPGWWDAVGEWEESAPRFPGGLREVLDRIRATGMVPGLWLEPEVVGVRSPVAAALPDEAFFQRDGVRLAEWGRHQLDLRHPAARAHLDTVVDRLVRDHGVGYLKLDYNIDIGPGTDGPGPGDGPGDGLLGHNRAYLDWLDGVLDRHPALVLESCAAGGSRTDHAILSRLPIHSVTDQQDFRLLPAIAAAAPTAVTPEQGAVWAYPLPEHGDAELGMVMVSALLGRIHLSGRPDLLTGEQAALVRRAVDTYKTFRHLLPDHPAPLAAGPSRLARRLDRTGAERRGRHDPAGPVAARRRTGDGHCPPALGGRGRRAAGAVRGRPAAGVRLGRTGPRPAGGSSGRAVGGAACFRRGFRRAGLSRIGGRSPARADGLSPGTYGRPVAGYVRTAGEWSGAGAVPQSRPRRRPGPEQAPASGFYRDVSAGHPSGPEPSRHPCP